MTKQHSDVLGALDGFFDAVRRRAETDPTFAAEIAKALAIPVEIKIERAGDVSANILFIEPRVIAAKGELAFRELFTAMDDKDKKKVIAAYNLAPGETLSGKGAPKGLALVEIMWAAANAQRARMQGRE